MAKRRKYKRVNLLKQKSIRANKIKKQSMLRLEASKLQVTSVRYLRKSHTFKTRANIKYQKANNIKL